MPADRTGVGVEGERRVVVEVPEVGAAEHELRSRRGDRRADVQEVQGRVVAGRGPGPDVPPLLERNVAPGLVARLARRRDGAPPPQLPAGGRVVGHDDARVRPAERRAAAARDHLAVRDDRPGRLVGRVLRVVEDLGLPDEPARRRVEGEDVVVRAGVDDDVVVDGDVPVDADEAGDHVLGGVVGHRPAVLPDEIARRGVERLDDVVGVRRVQHAVVDQRRALLAPLAPERARPDQPQIGDVVAIDLLERAVAPAVERAAPHQPVAGGRILEHRVGNRHEAGRRLGERGARHERQHAVARAASSMRLAVRLGRNISGLLSRRDSANDRGADDRRFYPGPARAARRTSSVATRGVHGAFLRL